MAPKLAEMSLPLVESRTAGVTANQRWGDGGVPADRSGKSEGLVPAALAWSGRRFQVSIMTRS